MELEGTVIYKLEDKGSVDRPVLVVDVPKVSLMSAVPEDCVVMAAGGTVLCHAAMVARHRSLKALFQVGSAVLQLQKGDRVRISTLGRVDKK